MTIRSAVSFESSLLRGKQCRRLFGRHFHITATAKSGKEGARSFVIGYGSIMCPYSRAITAKELAGTPGTPVLVQNTERVWSKKSIKGMTAMGVRRVEGATCTGVLLPVTNQELLQFDEREAGYDRVKVPTSELEKVPFLDESIYHSSLNYIFEAETGEEASNDVWIYVPQKLCLPTEEKPIAQTYLDTILRGCLTISEEFAIEFISSTKGWSSLDFQKNNNGSDLRNRNPSDEIFWVDDRQDPIYGRADHEYIAKNAPNLDKLLELYRPKEFPFRKTSLIRQ